MRQAHAPARHRGAFGAGVSRPPHALARPYDNFNDHWKLQNFAPLNP